MADENERKNDNSLVKPVHNSSSPGLNCNVGNIKPFLSTVVSFDRNTLRKKPSETAVSAVVLTELFVYVCFIQATSVY